MSIAQTVVAPPVKSPHPALFLVLLTPFGAPSGYVTFTVAYLLGAHRLNVAALAPLRAGSHRPPTREGVGAPPGRSHDVLAGPAGYVFQGER